jgi:tRNA(fMet)-specific endonuclease VapC
MKYLLDTNVIIQLLRKGLHLEKIEGLGEGATGISVITYYELLVGIEKSLTPELRDQKKRHLENYLATTKVIMFTQEEARIAAKVRAELESRGKMIGANDLLIAATAQANKLTIVTDNTKEFSRVSDLEVENWCVS